MITLTKIYIFFLCLLLQVLNFTQLEDNEKCTANTFKQYGIYIVNSVKSPAVLSYDFSDYRYFMFTIIRKVIDKYFISIIFTKAY